MTRTVNLHLAGACKVPPGSSGVYVATGDYDPPAQNHSTILFTDQPGQTIDGIPNDVASLSLTAEADDGEWLGVSLVPSAGDVDMLFLPSGSPCALSIPVGFLAQATLGASSASTLVVAPGIDAKNEKYPSFAIDLSKGHVAQMANGLTQPRVRAAFAALGDGRAVVSGGVTTSNPVFLGNAQIFDESSNDFEPQPCSLPEERADHASVALADGEVLLVGGQNLDGLLAQTALFSADSCRANESNSPTLIVPRINPVALRLADGSVLVGGGFSDAAATTPVGLVEFFSADASQPLAQQPVPAKSPSGFVALEGGGALYVGAGDGTNVNAWFVDKSGAQQIASIAATDVKLFAHAGGGAVLWNGTSWLLFNPWNEMTPFSVIASPTTGPAVDSPIATSDPGMRAWVNDDGTVSVWRDSVRNAFASDDTFLTAQTQTALLAPDSYPPPAFDSTLGLTLDPGQTVFVSDSRYLDVAIDVASTGASPPHVVLRVPTGDIEVGGALCPYSPNSTISSVHVVREGALVQFAAGGAFSTCTTIDPTVRVAVGIRGADGGSRALDLHVARRAR